MSRRPHWLIECLDLEEAELLLQSAPHGSKIELVPKENTELVILWVPVPKDVLEAELFDGGDGLRDWVT
jgi:hypothetical protein